ncbi:MAG: hypothetical protein Q9188_005668 [Gyalolechia gomerana]
MSSRKRCLSPSRVVDHQPSKRARLLSDLWPSDNCQYTQSTHPSQSSGKSDYTIRAIIGEKSGEYLIDWADNRYTGEAYSPDWQPKRNVSKEAIAEWENRKVARGSKRKSNRRRRKRSSSLSITIHCSRSRKPKRPKYHSSSCDPNQIQTVRSSRNTSSSDSSAPAITVLVSQHSSLDREQYILYQSSLSLSTSSSLPRSSNSLRREYSPVPKGFFDDHSPRVEAIPDSQSTSAPFTEAILSRLPTESGPNLASSRKSELIASRFEVPESISIKEDQAEQQAQRSQHNEPIRVEHFSKDSTPSGVNQSVAPVGGISHPTVSFPQDRSPQRSVEGSTSIEAVPAEGSSQSGTNCRSLYRDRRDRLTELVISEDQGDKTSTTQETTSSSVLTQRNTSFQSQPQSYADDNLEAPASLTAESRKLSSPVRQISSTVAPSSHNVSTHNYMAESNASALPGRASQASSEPEGPVRISLREGLKQMRAASRANEDARISNIRQNTNRSPVNATFVPQEPFSAARTPERRPSQIPATNSPRQAQPTPPRPAVKQGPHRVNGFPPGQQVIPSQPLFPPPSQPYLPSGQQIPFMVRPMPMQVDVPLAVRTTQSGQHTQIPQNHGPYVPQTPYVPKHASLAPCGLGVNEHTIGLAMNLRVRDQYTSVINLFRKPLDDFMNSDMPQETSIQEVRKLLARVNLITAHPDLDAQEAQEEFSQTTPEDEAGWAEECSFKFKFLGRLFSHMRNDGVHISIVARPGPTLDLIETFLKGRGVAYFRPDGRGSSPPNEQRFADCRIRISIVPSGAEAMNLAVQPAALVIAFDDTFNVQDLQVQRMRTQPGIEYIMPAVHLLVYKSAEHIARCLDVQMDGMARFRKIISCMTQLRRDVGKLPPEDMSFSAAADEVAIFLRLNGHQLKWALPPIRPIPLDVLEPLQDGSTQGSSQSSEQDAPIQNSALKRVWVSAVIPFPALPGIEVDRHKDPDSSNSEAAKRQRAQIDHLQRQNAYLTEQNAHLKTQIENIVTSLTTIQADLSVANRTNQDLSSELSTHATRESHISDLEASLSDLQTRYEDKDRSHHYLHIQRSATVIALEETNKKLDRQTSELATLKATKKSLLSDLEQARHDLLNTDNLDLTRIPIRKHLRRGLRRAGLGPNIPPRNRGAQSKRRGRASGGSQSR